VGARRIAVRSPGPSWSNEPIPVELLARLDAAEARPALDLVATFLGGSSELTERAAWLQDGRDRVRKALEAHDIPG
jgi:hypothetical protein